MKRFDGAHAAYLMLNATIVAFLLLPIAIVIVFALNPTPYIAFPPVGLTLRWFVKFFTSPEFMNALWLSLYVAVIVVVLSTVIGAMCALELVKDRRTKEPAKEATERFTQLALRRGLITITAGTFGNVIRTLMPLIITDEELEFGLGVIEETLKEVEVRG